MIYGDGLKKVLLLSEYRWQLEHPLLDRLINRSGGLDRSHFYFADLKTPNLQSEIQRLGIKVVVGLGEPVLRHMAGEKDVLRWRGRVITGLGYSFIPTFAPHKLLPEKMTEAKKAQLKLQGITPLTNPPRFMGTWMRDVEFAQFIAKNGYVRKRADYLIDPAP